MARARNIKPGFFKNEELAELGAETMLLFAGLWTLADREGRLEDRPKRIKAEVFPYFDNCNIDKLLGDLATSGFIVRYVVAERGYISIPKFDKHQNPHGKEAASTIPAPGEHRASTVLVPEIPERAGLIPDSGFLIPDSPNRAIAPVVRMTPRPPSVPMSERFEEFWSRHPGKKLRKDMAAGVWAHMVTVENDVALFACLDRYMDSQEVANRAFMNPENWLSECAAGGFTASWPARASPPQQPGLTQWVRD